MDAAAAVGSSAAFSVTYEIDEGGAKEDEDPDVGTSLLMAAFDASFVGVVSGRVAFLTAPEPACSTRKTGVASGSRAWPGEGVMGGLRPDTERGTADPATDGGQNGDGADMTVFPGEGSDHSLACGFEPLEERVTEVSWPK